jgi:uncharacterized protein (DUF488 family)
MAIPCVHSLGYQGRSLPDFVAELQGRGVRTLVDVRLNPISRKPGFSRKTLSAALALAGIDYVHEPELGNPRENRAAFRNGEAAAWDLLRARMEEPPGRAALGRLVELAQRQSVAVLCFEEAPEQCHRRLVTDLARRLDPALEVVE